jgi:hypothetical protein
MSPTIFREKGYRFYFLSNEEDRIYVHITSEDGEAKFWLESNVSLAVYFGLSTHKLSEIQSLITEHKDEIVEEWKKHFSKH